MAARMISRHTKYIGLATITITFAYTLFLSWQKDDFKISPIEETLSDDTRQKILVIMTQTRSGSTFTGEIFAATNNSMYLYEPLYPYGLDCTLPKERVALLKQLLSCDFTDLRETFLSAFNISNWKNDGAKCVHDGLCFSEKTRGMLESHRKTCRLTPKADRESSKCGYPLKHDLLRNICESSSLLITKVNRMCTLDEMDDVYRHLKAGKRDVYILHMLRDVRASTSTLMKLNKKENVKNIVSDIIKSRCPRQRQNVIYKSKAPQDYAMMADGRYMRIRHEDITINAIASAKRVFQFMGRSLPPEVVNNIRTYLHPNASILQRLAGDKNIKKKKDKFSKQYSSPHGVVRDPIKVLNEWRNLVPFKHVQEIQVQCGDVLKELGYITFSSEEEMKDLTRPSFEISNALG